MNITIDTPVEELLNAPGSRQKLLKLAQLVFGRSGIEAYRAFSQFPGNSDLATLVAAKRKNVFDYGRCIQTDAKGNTRFPSNPTAIMGAVSHAVDGNYDDIDFRVLGLVDEGGNPTVKLSELCPASDPKPEKKTRAKKAKPPELVVVQDEPEEEEVPPKVIRIPKERASVSVDEVNKLAAAQEEDATEKSTRDETINAVFLTGEAVIDDLDARIQGHIGKLREDLADAFQGSVEATKAISAKAAGNFEDEIGYVKKDVEDIKASQIALAAFLNTINSNIEMVLQCFDPHGEVEPCPPEVLALLEGAAPDDIEERLEAAPVDTVDLEEAPPVVNIEPVVVEDEPEEEEEAPSTDKSYTRDELMAMSLPDLVKLATSLGVPNANAIPYKTSLVQRVCKLAKK